MHFVLLNAIIYVRNHKDRKGIATVSFFNNAGSPTYNQNEKALSEISELDMAITQEEKMISEIYEQIGIQYYNSNKDNPDADFKVMISRINAALQRIEEYRHLIEQIRAVVICEKCGAEVATGLGMTNCVRCGKPVNAHSDASTIKCIFCGQLLMADTNFCTGCGKPMSEILNNRENTFAGSAPVPEDSKTDAPLKESAVPETVSDGENEIPMANEVPVPDEQTEKCPMCGSDITDEMFFCTSCGEKLK